MVGVRIPVSYKQMVDNIAERNNMTAATVLKEYIVDGIEKTNTDTIVEHSKIKELTDELKDFLSVNISKSENRIASLLSKILITNYENRGMMEELLRLIVEQIYQEKPADEIIEDIQRKVNTAAIVKLKTKKKITKQRRHKT